MYVYTYVYIYIYIWKSLNVSTRDPQSFRDRRMAPIRGAHRPRHDVLGNIVRACAETNQAMLRGNHLSNTTCLTYVLFRIGRVRQVMS